MRKPQCFWPSGLMFDTPAVGDAGVLRGLSILCCIYNIASQILPVLKSLPAG